MIKKVYDLFLKFLFIIGYYTKVLKNGKNYKFSYNIETKNAIIEAFNNNNLLIVSNHMTLVDSTLIQLFIIEIFGWFGVIKSGFRTLLWNLPAIENLLLLKDHSVKTHKFIYNNINRILPIDRSNQDSSTKTLENAAELILDGSVFLIFPEAGRTRRNEFSEEDITPGAAKILLDCEKKSGKIPGLLVIYVRAKQQIGYSNLPFNDDIIIYATYTNSFKIKDDLSSIRKRKNLMIIMGNLIKEMQNKFHLDVNN